MARITKRDWFVAATNILRESGAQQLTIDALLVKVGKTKGSFYHHFDSYDDFIGRFLHYFEHEGALQLGELVELEESPQLRLHKLISVITSFPSELEAAMRAWAFQDERVWDVFERVDQRRVRFIWEQFRPIVKDDRRALTLARTTYAIFVGSEHMLPPISSVEQRALFDAFLSRFGVPSVIATAGR